MEDEPASPSTIRDLRRRGAWGGGNGRAMVRGAVSHNSRGIAPHGSMRDLTGGWCAAHQNSAPVGRRLSVRASVSQLSLPLVCPLCKRLPCPRRIPTCQLDRPP
eukprot:scaffold21250_cov111-Isochrysis_galbana.AAC.4